MKMLKLSLNVDFNKTTKVFDLIYGIGARYQNVNSTANLTSDYQLLYNTTRYPNDGSQVSDFFAYSQVKIAPIKKLDVSIGVRWNSQKLMCNFNNLDFDLNNIKTSNSSLIKSILLSYKPINHTILSRSYYDGFRNQMLMILVRFLKKTVKMLLCQMQILSQNMHKTLSCLWFMLKNHLILKFKCLNHF